MAKITHTSTGASNSPRELEVKGVTIKLDYTDMFLDIQAEYVDGIAIMNNIPFGEHGKQSFGNLNEYISVEAPSGGSTAPVFVFGDWTSGTVYRADKIGMATTGIDYVNTYIIVHAAGAPTPLPSSPALAISPIETQGLVGANIVASNKMSQIKPNGSVTTTDELHVAIIWSPIWGYTWQTAPLGSLSKIIVYKQINHSPVDPESRYYTLESYSITPSSVTLLGSYTRAQEPIAWPGRRLALKHSLGEQKVAAYLGWKRNLEDAELKIVAQYMSNKYGLGLA